MSTFVQEKLGEQDQKVTVGPKETKTVDELSRLRPSESELKSPVLLLPFELGLITFDVWR